MCCCYFLCSVEKNKNQLESNDKNNSINVEVNELKIDSIVDC